MKQMRERGKVVRKVGRKLEELIEEREQGKGKGGNLRVVHAAVVEDKVHAGELLAVSLDLM